MIDQTLPMGADGAGQTAETTGKYVVVFADVDANPARMLESVLGASSVANSRDFADQEADATQAPATVFAELGVAVVAADPDQLSALQTSPDAQGAILSIAPERIYHPLQSTGYLEGYRDAVADLAGRLGAGSNGSSAATIGGQVGVAQFPDTATASWGLQATRVLSSPQSGKGIKVAILDTGFETAHPDFVGRNITLASFIPGETPKDGHGHGTHCTGTACGPKNPSGSRRYGIAYESDIFIGKVLSNSGSGSDTSVLGGMNWAIAQGCHVVSMSLGANVQPPHPPYTEVGRRALDKGTLVVAAAGNNARRHERSWGFVGAPANSPYIMAIAALEQDLSVAYFSARSSTSGTGGQRGGQVDNAGPGWQVYSSWILPQKYHTISGTSMATPHASGIAALWAQKTGLRGAALWSVLAQESDRLYEPAVDVGGGLVLAPQ
ncbi:S8 family serine peptidase [Geodermatophilus sabuli]|uniref:Serine protease, subtilisin family n=1 Tax=Geodermatophilus sabuli TaxID=1564158 RepID=A0A285E6C3_9ACTN|nr:S8 family serine peptidase [Geodermatophilus sabuli]MBB3082461.1 subtilisin family serine protease [Geodermatophilus sabuli]SNX94669.1 Serine protease, subtilisin family [Geodermatophilus sabuli]